MIDQVEFFCSLTSLLLHLFQVLRKSISMALCSNPSTYAPPPPPLSWKRLAEPHVAARKRPKEASEDAGPNGFVLTAEGFPRADFTSESRELVPKGLAFEKEAHPQENLCSESYTQHFPLSRHRDIDSMQENNDDKEAQERAMVRMLGPDSMSMGEVGGGKAAAARKLRKRPARIVIPDSCIGSGFCEAGKGKESAEKELEVEGSNYCLASRKGSRHVMEDGHGAITNIHGDPQQAFFGVFDGHGGRAAVDFVSEKLGRNIITALSEVEDQSELAIRAGYLTTDREFLNQGVSSGACAATVVLKNGELHASNVGDCRVVMSRKGVATALTQDHSAGREDERARIESSGGYVTCRNGIWRVQDSLAVSRAIGDINIKEWVTSEPETTKLRLTPDCEFLIMASDGLWDKVSNQEAVDAVSRHKNSMKSCKELVDMACKRGTRDDVTVMVVDLQRFVQLGS